MKRFTYFTAALIATVLAACSPTAEQPLLAGVTRSEPLTVAHVALPDVTDLDLRGEGLVDDGLLSFRAAPDRLLLVYFGFTHCPDVCPATLADLRVALKAVSDPERVDLVFVTVDPGRDTADILNEYLPYFSERFHVVRTEDPDALQAAADAFLARYQVVEDSSSGAIEVSHTAVLYAVDSEGVVQVEWPFGTRPPQFAADLEILLGSA